MSLPHLPTELQNLIITNLHPTAAIALSKTNYHYHSTVSLHQLVFDTVRRFLFDLENRPDGSVEDEQCREKYACYKCLCMKPGSQFQYSEILDSCMKEYQGARHNRQCMECDVKDNRVMPGCTYLCWGKRMVVCIACLNAERCFCRGCRSCACCLEEKHAELCKDCGWCDTCVGVELVEWENKEGCHYGNTREDFHAKEACKHRFSVT